MKMIPGFMAKLSLYKSFTSYLSQGNSCNYENSDIAPSMINFLPRWGRRYAASEGQGGSVCYTYCVGRVMMCQCTSPDGRTDVTYACGSCADENGSIEPYI